MYCDDCKRDDCPEVYLVRSMVMKWISDHPMRGPEEGSEAILARDLWRCLNCINREALRLERPHGPSNPPSTSISSLPDWP